MNKEQAVALSFLSKSWLSSFRYKLPKILTVQSELVLLTLAKKD
jgi:hypothetical protein